jgi:hypothetical protein
MAPYSYPMNYWMAFWVKNFPKGGGGAMLCIIMFFLEKNLKCELELGVGIIAFAVVANGHASVGLNRSFFPSVMGFLKPLKKFCPFACVISILLYL